MGLLVRGVGRFFSHGGYFFFSCWGGFSLTEGIFFSHRTHRFNRASLRTVSNSQKAFGIQISQNFIANVGCNVLCFRLT